jgi:hypothetical protein
MPKKKGSKPSPRKTIVRLRILPLEVVAKKLGLGEVVDTASPPKQTPKKRERQ